MLQCDWEFILTLSEVFFLSRWLCCPVYLTVAHKWLCRQGAHTRGGYTLGCPGSGKHSVSHKPTQWKIIRDCGWPQGGHALGWTDVTSHFAESSPSPPDASVLRLQGSPSDCSLNGRVVSGAKLKSPRKNDTVPKHIDITVPLAGRPLFGFYLPPLLLLKKKNNTWTHFTKHSSFLSKVGLSEDGLSLLIRHKCSWLASCNVCYRAVLLVKKKSFQLRDRPYLRTCHLASLHGCSIGTFWVCFTNVIVFTHGPQISVWVFLSWP